MVAHAHGVARAVEDRDWVFDMLRRLTVTNEAPRSVPWSVSDAPVPESELRLEADLPRICAAAGVVRAAMTASACGDDTVEQYFAVRLQDI